MEELPLVLERHLANSKLTEGDTEALRAEMTMWNTVLVEKDIVLPALKDANNPQYMDRINAQDGAIIAEAHKTEDGLLNLVDLLKGEKEASRAPIGSASLLSFLKNHPFKDVECRFQLERRYSEVSIKPSDGKSVREVSFAACTNMEPSHFGAGLIGTLVSFENLERLDLSDCGIEDCSPVASLKLTTLILNKNPLRTQAIVEILKANAKANDSTLAHLELKGCGLQLDKKFVESLGEVALGPLGKDPRAKEGGISCLNKLAYLDLRDNRVWMVERKDGVQEIENVVISPYDAEGLVPYPKRKNEEVKDGAKFSQYWLFDSKDKVQDLLHATWAPKDYKRKGRWGIGFKLPW